MRTCITLHPHELALCPGPVTVLRPCNEEYKQIRSSCSGTFSIDSLRPCPYGQPGDVLAVRETWRPYEVQGKRTRIQFANSTLSKWSSAFHPRWPIRVYSPQMMPAALARWRFTLEGVEVKRAETLNFSEYRCAVEMKWSKHYPRYPWASNPLLWVMRGNVETRV